MNKLLLHPLFVVCTILSTGNKLIEFAGFHIPFVHAWMDDIFCIPIMLTPTLFVMRTLVYNNDNYVFMKAHIVVAIIYCSIVFEVILPMQTSQHTSDIMDVGAYALGGIIFYKFINRTQLMPSVSRAERNISSASSLV